MGASAAVGKYLAKGEDEFLTNGGIRVTLGVFAQFRQGRFDFRLGVRIDKLRSVRGDESQALVGRRILCY